MKNSAKFIALLILFAAVAMFSILPATAAVVSTTQIDKTFDNEIKIEAKYKKVNKITFNANGGKINKKNTISLNINNGAKIKKFPATPKRNGYTFKGWYTKKSGGTKISVNTKPTKSVTYYAQWTKKGVNANIDSKLLGSWWCTDYNTITSKLVSRSYQFKTDGTFEYWRGDYNLKRTGNYKASKGKITFTNIISHYDNGTKNNNYPNTVAEYEFKNINGGQYLRVNSLDWIDSTYLSITGGKNFKKGN